MTDLMKPGKVIEYLAGNGKLLTEAMGKLSKGLYAVLSNEGVHAMGTGSEYVRLCRNMVIEYAIVHFCELERRLK